MVVNTTQHYVYDIETEGLAPGDGDEVTVVGFRERGEDGEHIIFYQETDEPVAEEELVASTEVTLVGCESEAELFEEMMKWSKDEELDLNENTAIIGFNSRKFDSMFIRSRCLATGSNFPLSNVTEVDVFNAARYNLIPNNYNLESIYNTNTRKTPLQNLAETIGAYSDGTRDDIKNSIDKTIEEMDEERKAEVIELLKESELVDNSKIIDKADSLDNFYNLLPDSHYTVVEDPFDDSEEAVESFQEGDVQSVIQHNIADLEKTEGLVDGLTTVYFTSQESLLTDNSVSVQTL